MELPPPLRSVVSGSWTARGGLVTRLQLNETVAYMARATCVTVACETPGELLLSDRSVHFVPDDVEEKKPASNKKKDLQLNPEVRSPAQSWPLESVVQVSAAPRNTGIAWMRYTRDQPAHIA